MRRTYPDYRRVQERRAEQEQNTLQHQSRIDAICSVKTSIDGIRNDHRHSERARRIREWMTIIALGIAAIVAGYGIWRTHQDTLAAIAASDETADQQHKDTLAALDRTDEAIGKTTKQVAAAEAANEITRQNFEIQTRPYIVVERITTYNLFQKVMISELEVRNFGQTPAFDIYVFGDSSIKMRESGIKLTDDLHLTSCDTEEIARRNVTRSGSFTLGAGSAYKIEQGREDRDGNDIKYFPDKELELFQSGQGIYLMKRCSSLRRFI